jgi:anti-sigma factor RsiW
MNTKHERLIGGALDGALDPAERAEADRLLATQPEARAQWAAWDAVGDAVRREAGQVVVPDPRAAWLDIRRELRGGAAAGEVVDLAPARAHSLRRLRWAAGLAGLFMLAMAGTAVWQVGRGGFAVTRAVPDVPPAAERVEWVVAGLPGATTMIYTDSETDMTVIWMDVAQGPDPRDS